MEINIAEPIQESIVEHLWKERGKQEGMKVLTRKSILTIIKRVKHSIASYELKELIEGINELETLNAILAEIWNVKDIEKIWAVINKYDWLEEMKRLDAE